MKKRIRIGIGSMGVGYIVTAFKLVCRESHPTGIIINRNSKIIALS